MSARWGQSDEGVYDEEEFPPCRDATRGCMHDGAGPTWMVAGMRISRVTRWYRRLYIVRTLVSFCRRSGASESSATATAAGMKTSRRQGRNLLGRTQCYVCVCVGMSETEQLLVCLVVVLDKVVVLASRHASARSPP